MQHTPILASTPAGHTYNVEWPGDRAGGGSKPAVPVKHRGDFVADVRGENAEGAALTIPQLRKKWGKRLPADRTLFKWVAWAKKLVPEQTK